MCACVRVCVCACAYVCVCVCVYTYGRVVVRYERTRCKRNLWTNNYSCWEKQLCRINQNLLTWTFEIKSWAIFTLNKGISFWVTVYQKSDFNVWVVRVRFLLFNCIRGSQLDLYEDFKKMYTFYQYILICFIYSLL